MHIKEKLAYRRVCVVTLLALAVNSVVFVDDACALPRWTATQDIGVMRAAERRAIEGYHEIIHAESDASARALLEENHSADSLLSSDGKIVLSERTSRDDLLFLRAVTHKSIEALMQVIAYDDARTYDRIEALILPLTSVREKYFALPGKKPEMPTTSRLRLNDIIATAFELILLNEKGLLPEYEMTPLELAFFREIRPVIMGARHTYFTGAFWDRRTRNLKIRAALAGGIRFSQTSGSATDDFRMLAEGNAMRVRDIIRNRGILTKPGERAPRYKIGRRIGGYASGDVHEAVNCDTGETVVVKCMMFEDDPCAQNLFEREIAILKRLREDGYLFAPKYIDSYVEPSYRDDPTGYGWIVMEKIEGYNLKAAFLRKGIREKLDAFKKILDMLTVLHDYGIIHRDLSPRHILVTREGDIKIIDFGIAWMPGFSAIPNNDLAADETYAPPEISYAEENQLTAAVDIFHMGVTLFELATNDARVNYFNFQDFYPWFRERQLRKKMPREWQAFAGVVNKSTLKDPENRYQSAAEMKAAIEAVENSVFPLTITVAARTVRQKDIGGEKADNKRVVNPKIREWIERGKVVKLRLTDEPVFYVPQPIENFSGREDDFGAAAATILRPYEIERLKGYINKYLAMYPPRSDAPLTARDIMIGIVKGVSMVNPGGEEKFSIVHAGKGTQTIWFGELILRDLLAKENDPDAEAVFEHEIKHITRSGTAAKEHKSDAYRALVARMKERCAAWRLIENPWMQVFLEKRRSAEQDRSFVETFLLRNHPLKDEVFSEIDRLSDDEVLALADNCLTMGITEEDGFMGFNVGAHDERMGRALTLRELFIRPTNGSIDLAQAFFANGSVVFQQPKWIDFDASRQGEAHTKGLLKSHYVLVKAIEILSRRGDTVLITDDDVTNTVDYLRNLRLVRPETAVQNLTCIAVLCREGTDAQNTSLINLGRILTRLEQNAGSVWKDAVLGFLPPGNGIPGIHKAMSPQTGPDGRVTKIYRDEILFRDYFEDMVENTLALCVILSRRMTMNDAERLQAVSERDRLVSALLKCGVRCMPQRFRRQEY
ncbi:MAG: serine/threonine-protein kinase, partial [Candidatus Omnitrophota bacterium]